MIQFKTKYILLLAKENMLCMEKNLPCIIAWFLEVATLNEYILVFVSSNAVFCCYLFSLNRKSGCAIPGFQIMEVNFK